MWIFQYSLSSSKSFGGLLLVSRLLLLNQSCTSSLQSWMTGHGSCGALRARSLGKQQDARIYFTRHEPPLRWNLAFDFESLGCFYGQMNESNLYCISFAKKWGDLWMDLSLTRRVKVTSSSRRDHSDCFHMKISTIKNESYLDGVRANETTPAFLALKLHGPNFFMIKLQASCWRMNNDSNAFTYGLSDALPSQTRRPDTLGWSRADALSTEREIPEVLMLCLL